MSSNGSRGRGRGISNEPAWMSRQQQQNGDKERPPGSDNIGGGENGADHEGGGGGGMSRSSRSRSPERDQYGRIRSGSRERGGGGPRRDDGYGGGPRRGGGRDGRYREDFGPYGPPRGGGGGYGSGGEGGRDRGRYDREPRRRRRSPPRSRGGGNRSGIYFNSLAEEMAWVEERRRKRRSRKSLFDVEPTPEQVALAEANEARVAAAAAHSHGYNGDGRASSSGGIYGPASGASSGKDRAKLLQAQPQQTRHARRLYIGHLPPDLSEDNVHEFFRDSIHTAMNKMDPAPEDDPILSVYINVERRFAFLEFKTMEVCTATLALDGINILGKGKVKVKRPNDYNPAMAPTPNPALLPNFDVSKLGIVSPSVPDGPNKIFIGGLPYHLTEEQVLELFRAFGQVRAFHLVKADPTAVTSKGYCFVEYADPAVTPVAVMGLNGMDMGGGKVLSARMAAARGTIPAGGSQEILGASADPTAAAAVPAASAASSSNIVDGVDVEELLDIAMGLKPATTVVPMQATMMQPVVAAPLMMTTAVPQIQQVQPQANGHVPSMATAPAAAGAAPVGSAAPAPPPPVAQAAVPAPAAPSKTRILVLHNMVMDEDLSTEEDYEGLSDEVREECEKFGKLVSMKIPRPQDGYAPSAVKKIFLEYSTSDDSANAEKELAGRQFGPNTVEVTYCDEDAYLSGNLK